VAPAPPVQPAAAAQTRPAATDRRQTMRFVWQMDADGRLTIGTEEFIAMIGAQSAKLLGRPWRDVAAELDVDPEGQVERAIATRDTWSGIHVAFPMDGNESRLPVELSGLPVFDRERNFLGYRGFGVCRNVPSAVKPQPETIPAPPLPLPPEPVASVAPKTEIVPAAPVPPAETPEAKAPPQAEPPAPRDERPALTVVPPVENVLPFRASAPPEKSPNLTPVERKAFRELASKLTARLREAQNGMTSGAATDDVPSDLPFDEPAVEPPPPPSQPVRTTAPAAEAERTIGSDQRPILDRLPLGVLVYRLDRLLYANRAFLDWTGYDSIHALADAGGLDALFIEPVTDASSAGGAKGDAKTLAITTSHGSQVPIEARLFSTPWDGESALVLMLAGTPAERRKDAEAPPADAATEARELRAILDTATDGVIVLDCEGRVISTNRSAELMFGHQSRELGGLPLAGLFAPESQRIAFDTLDRVNREGSAGTPSESREVLGRGREGVPIPLVMTMGRIAGTPDKLVAIFRDVAAWKNAEENPTGGRRQAETASSAKSDFLAKISHEIRTPLNAIIGFSEVMMEERFGPVGNERYKQYLKDIHASGTHLISLLNDLLDLSKIEAGKLDLTFVRLDLNEVTQQCVALMQPQASRERIIIRTALSSTLPPVLADARSVRQIALNLLSNSIKFTNAGGQVIVSTAAGDNGGVVLRVRDTGVGMSEKDIAVALEPFRQLATSPRTSLDGTGLGLPLTKALAEANRATFNIKSAVNAGTLIEVAFPGTPLAAE
jgi:PAS domain S-box-containing protein